MNVYMHYNSIKFNLIVFKQITLMLQFTGIFAGCLYKYGLTQPDLWRDRYN